MSEFVFAPPGMNRTFVSCDRACYTLAENGDSILEHGPGKVVLPGFSWDVTVPYIPGDDLGLALAETFDHTVGALQRQVKAVRGVFDSRQPGRYRKTKIVVLKTPDVLPWGLRPGDRVAKWNVGEGSPTASVFSDFAKGWVVQARFGLAVMAIVDDKQEEPFEFEEAEGMTLDNPMALREPTEDLVEPLKRSLNSTLFGDRRFYR